MNRGSLNVNRRLLTVDYKDFIFDFERLEVYKLALDFVSNVFNITSTLPWELQHSLGDNFRRAVLSIVNNIAEGSGKISLKEKKHYYKIAHTSDRECIPMITLLKRRNLIDFQTYDYLRNSCIRISCMVFKLEESVGKQYENKTVVHDKRIRKAVNGERCTVNELKE